MVYNLTGLTANGTGMLGLIQGVNQELTFGWLGTMLLISLAMVFFGSFFFTTRDMGKAFAATAYISFVLSIFLRTMGLIPNIVLFITLILTAGVIAITWQRD